MFVALQNIIASSCFKNSERFGRCNKNRSEIKYERRMERMSETCGKGRTRRFAQFPPPLSDAGASALHATLHSLLPQLFQNEEKRSHGCSTNYYYKYVTDILS